MGIEIAASDIEVECPGKDGTVHFLSRDSDHHDGDCPCYGGGYVGLDRMLEWLTAKVQKETDGGEYRDVPYPPPSCEIHDDCGRGV